MNTFEAGHYHEKQLNCKNGIIAWSHQSRFEMALSLIGKSTNKLFDYGSGDGTFLSMASTWVGEGWGADIAEDQIKDCQIRLKLLGNIHFTSISSLKDDIHAAAYDVVTCMETLEHCTDEVVDIIISDLVRLVSPHGKIIISVPIEIGPTFLFKLFIRKIAGWRGLSDYRNYENYTVADALKMIFATKETEFNRPIYGLPDHPYYSHYQFNWKRTRETVSRYMIVEKTMFSPLNQLGGFFSSQVWFICKPYNKI